MRSLGNFSFQRMWVVVVFNYFMKRTLAQLFEDAILLGEFV